MEGKEKRFFEEKGRWKEKMGTDDDDGDNDDEDDEGRQVCKLSQDWKRKD